MNKDEERISVEFNATTPFGWHIADVSHVRTGEPIAREARWKSLFDLVVSILQRLQWKQSFL